MKITKRQLRKIIREYFARHTVEDYVSPDEREERAAEELDWLTSKVFVGNGLDYDALRDFEAAADRFNPVDVIYAIWDWGQENPQEPGSDFFQGEAAEVFGEQALNRLGITPEPGGNARLIRMLDEIFANVGV